LFDQIERHQFQSCPSSFKDCLVFLTGNVEIAKNVGLNQIILRKPNLSIAKIARLPRSDWQKQVYLNPKES